MLVIFQNTSYANKYHLFFYFFQLLIIAIYSMYNTVYQIMKKNWGIKPNILWDYWFFYIVYLSTVATVAIESVGPTFISVKFEP